MMGTTRFQYDDPSSIVSHIVQTRFRRYYVEIYEDPETEDYQVNIYRLRDRNRLFKKPLRSEWYARTVPWTMAVREILTELELPLYHREEFLNWDGTVDTRPRTTVVQAEWIDRADAAEGIGHSDIPVYDWLDYLPKADDEEDDD